MFGLRNPTAICFRCRRSYKGAMPVCPTCGHATLRKMNFKPPPRQNIKEWARLEQLVQVGALDGSRRHSRYVTRRLLARAAKLAEIQIHWGSLQPQSYLDHIATTIDRAMKKRQ